jgi:hypothetical protein
VTDREDGRDGTRAHWATALLGVGILLTAASCGGGSDGAAPPTGGRTPAASTTSSTLPFVATVVPDTPVGRQLQWLLQVMGGAPLATPTIDAHFAPSFLAQVDPPKLNDVLVQLAGGGSPTFVGLLPISPLEDPSEALRAVVTLGGTPLTVSLQTDATGRISGLVYAPYVPTTLDSWPAVDSALGAIAPGTGLLVARIGPSGDCVPVHQVDASASRPTGSMFKLFVLGAVADRIAAGTVRWDQELTLTDALRSSGSGSLQDRPAGTRLTVRQAADLMISQSDNTAADLLIHLVGRSAVEARTRAWSSDAQRDQPFLTTREFFVLKEVDYPALADAYTGRDPSARAAYLAATVDGTPLSQGSGDWTTPRSIDSVEWFASPTDLCRAFAGLAVQSRQSALAPIGSVLSSNQGGIGLDPGQWPTVWFKGGSEPGVLTLGYLARQGDGTTDVVVAMAEDPSAPLGADATLRMLTVVKGAFGLLGKA